MNTTQLEELENIKTEDFYFVEKKEISYENELMHIESQEYTENSTIPIEYFENYKYIDEAGLIDKKIEFFVEYNRKIKESPFKIEEDQRITFIKVLNQLSDLIPQKNFEIQFTYDNEIQLFFTKNGGTVSLIIDEFGGLAFSNIRKKGLGYTFNYLEFEKIENKNVYFFSKDFISNMFH